MLFHFKLGKLEIELGIGAEVRIDDDEVDDEKVERQGYECLFNTNNGITEEELKNCAYEVAASIDGLTIENVDGSIINCIVEANDDNDVDWRFTLDLNDCGLITGRNCWITSEKNSDIPPKFTQKLTEKIKPMLLS